MYNWEKEMSDSLKAIVDKYSENDDLKNYSEYCRFMELGLRKKALESVKLFVSQLALYDSSKQQSIANELIELQYFNQNIFKLQSFPLQEKLIAILEHWIICKDVSAIPFRWLGYLKNDSSYYKDALERDSKDQISIVQLAKGFLANVDFQMHHLGESILLGTTEDAEIDLDQAQTFIEQIDSIEIIEQLIGELNQLRTILELWNKYKADEVQIPFPDWSRTEGFDFRFPSTFYYENS